MLPFASAAAQCRGYVADCRTEPVRHGMFVTDGRSHDWGEIPLASYHTQGQTTDPVDVFLVRQSIPAVPCGVVVQVVMGRKIRVLRLNIGVVRINTVWFGLTEMRQPPSVISMSAME